MATSEGRAIARHGMQKRGAFVSIAFVGTLVVCPSAPAGGSMTAYKCVVEGSTIYSDRPCSVGQQSTYAIEAPEPTPADRAAAEARRRDDQRALAAMQREREKRDVIKPVSSRIQADRVNQARVCSRLALRAKRAAEDYERAGPRDQFQKQIRSRRAEEDRAATCAKR